MKDYQAFQSVCLLCQIIRLFPFLRLKQMYASILQISISLRFYKYFLLSEFKESTEIVSSIVSSNACFHSYSCFPFPPDSWTNIVLKSQYIFEQILVSRQVLSSPYPCICSSLKYKSVCNFS